MGSSTFTVRGLTSSVLHAIASLCLFLIVSSALVDKAEAERLFFRSYGASDGLSSLGGICAVQDKAGYILVCSDHGLFAYNGRDFRNLGPAQGLRDGGIVEDLGLTADGRIAVRYADQLFVSQTSDTKNLPPNALGFRSTNLAGKSFYNDRIRQLAPFGGGFAIIVGRETMKVLLSSGGTRPALRPMGYNAAERADLDRPAKLFSVRGKLWETFDDGRLCSADPGFVRCYGGSQGLSGGPWEDVVAGAGDTVLTRSVDFIARLDPVSGAISEQRLPDQGGPYVGADTVLGLFRTPDGELLTQSADGLIVRKPSGWTRLTARDGIPSGAISSVIDDRDGNLWIQAFGEGFYRALDYGHWEGLQNDDGLSDGIAWQVVRPPGGSLWVSTDAGVDEVRRSGGALGVARVVSGPSYALAVGPSGDIWSSAGRSGARVINPATGSVRFVAVPFVDAIVAGSDHRVWLATEQGLYRVDPSRGGPPVAVLDAMSGTHVTGAIRDGSGGLWLLSGGRLWHRRSDGRCIAMAGPWPTGGFDPLAMANASNGNILVGGAGGLYELSVSGGRIVSLKAMSPPDVATTTVYAVTADRRGWVWVGTGQGVSVYNGDRWVSVDSDVGLVWNDVSQNGIFEDSDGSIWISTSRGLSHLIDPAWVFSHQPIRVVISDATLDGKRLTKRKLPHTTAPLSVQFGTLSYAREKSIVFRYRMSGVDKAWAESATGSVRYPWLPPGKHVLTVVGHDTLSHASSAPVSLSIDMAFPWWRRWWAELFYLLSVPTALYGFIRLRERAASRKQRERQHDLEVLVEERTRDMRAAQAELRHLATLDGLTGLLNRVEIQRRLVERLSSRKAAGDMLVGMIDLDHFKRINDVHGHLVGDDVLRAMTIRVAAVLRDGECAGRYGGEEVLVVLDDFDGRGAERILSLHQSIRGAAFHVDGVEIAVTCSIGIAWAGPGDDWKSLVGRADAALYEAKALGRDRIVESSDDQSLNPSAWPSVRTLKGGGST